MIEMIKVLVVDDSFFMRKLISDILNSDPKIKVVDTAKNGTDALKKIKQLQPDVVSLDYIMPEMGGLSTLKQIMKENPTPVVMLSAYTKEGADVTLKCLHAGAVGFVLKPSGAISLDIEKIKEQLINEIKTAAKASLSVIKHVRAILAKRPVIHPISPRAVVRERVVAIGSSTGGPAALEVVLTKLPFNIPAAILIVQHMPTKFTKSLAQRLDARTEIEVKEAEEGDLVEPGKAYIAPGDCHMIIKKKMIGGKVKAVISLNKNAPVHYLRPSIDVLMKSVAEVYGKNTVGVILTGMGEDGAEGMKAIKAAKGKTIVQNKATSLIYGMPEQVVKNGDADDVLPLSRISKRIVGVLSGI
jgi:two-component system, chemotaxis family, protein-glutamate methylesterase/glutaminase